MTIDAGPDELYTTLAREADVEALAALVNSAYRGESSRRGWTSEADLVGGTRTDAAALRELIASADKAILLLRAQSGLYACALLERRPEAVCCLDMLSVRPALQGSGIGRQMLAAAERYARQQFEARSMEITVIELREELLAWYERRGYVRSGESRPFPYADERSGLPLRDGLRVAVLTRELVP